MFSIGCCGNVLKQIIDTSNIPVDLSNVVLEISKTLVDASNVVTEISNIVENKELLFERTVETVLDPSNVEIHVVHAMNQFLNEMIDEKEKKE